MAKYIFVVGGVMSGVGKGIAAASIGKILQERKYKVTAVKIDPYINVDAGTMNPVEHGEVFVTDDGDETDQDIGNYERFLNVDITRTNYMTTGRVYQSVIQRERNLEFDGKCVEVVPHIPEEIIKRITKASRKAKADITLIEIGGTIGEYQNVLFLEAARMMHLKNPNDVLFILVSYLPVPRNLGEMKTKPTQYAARSLNSAGIQPDFIIARSSDEIDTPRKKKLSTFCNVHPQDVISAPDCNSIYEVPLQFVKEKLDSNILKKLGLRERKAEWKEWKKLVRHTKNGAKTIRIGIVAKYIDSGSYTLADSYISVIEALKHASWSEGVKVEIDWISTNGKEQMKKALSSVHGVIIPQGWGARGSEEKIAAIKYARVKKIPYLGLCYGMQMAVIEFARNVAKIKGANSLEIKPSTKNPVIFIMPEQKKNVDEKNYGGTIRLGGYPCKLKKGTLTAELYGNKRAVRERHRHRYEVNPSYRARLEKAGLVIAGTSPDDTLVESIEIKDHPFFIGTQFHPEYISRPLRPHPLFLGFVNASKKRLKK
jgi:CTP synthase